MENVLLDIIEVTPRPDGTLFLVFENGERRVYDVKPLMAKKPFDCLADMRIFLSARVDYGTVMWGDDIDIAPETLYDKSSAA